MRVYSRNFLDFELLSNIVLEFFQIWVCVQPKRVQFDVKFKIISYKNDLIHYFFKIFNVC